MQRLAEAELLLKQSKVRLERQREIVGRLRRGDLAAAILTPAGNLKVRRHPRHDRVRNTTGPKELGLWVEGIA